MYISKIELENFRTIEKATFAFNRGITCFSGTNGSGKSTVFNAINILLFDSYVGNYKEYVQWGKNQFSIAIEFSHEGRSYREEFLYSNTKGGSRSLTDLDTKEEWENSSALNKLKEIIDPDSAMASIVANQDESNLINTTPARRREYLKGIYNLEFKNELETISSDLQQTSNKVLELQGEITALQSQSLEKKEYKEVELSEEEFHKREAELEKVNLEISNIQTVIDKKATIEKSLEMSKRTKRRLQSSIDDTLSKEETSNVCISKIERDLSSISEKEEIRCLENTLSGLETSYTEEKNKLDALLLSLEDKLDKLGTEPSSEEYNSLVDRYNEYRANKSKSEFIVSQSQRRLDVLKKGKCPTCGHEVSREEVDKEQEYCNTEEKKLTRLIETVESLSKEVTERKSQIDSYRSSHRALSDSISSAKDKLKDIRFSYERESSKIKSQIEKVSSDVQHRKDLLNESLKSENLRIEEYKQSIRELQDEMDKVSEEVISLEKEYESIQIDDIDERKAYRDAIKSHIDRYNETIQYNKYVDEFNKEQEKKAVERSEKIASLEEEVERHNTHIAIATVAKGLLAKEFPSFVISYMTKTLENYVNEFLGKVYPKYQIKIKESKTSLSVLYGEHEADVKLASGFEKSVFSLAYMYALNKMQNYGLLIVDEGDHAADTVNAMNFYSTLGKSQEYFPQIFCISHKEEVKDLLRNNFNATVYVMNNGEVIRE